MRYIILDADNKVISIRNGPSICEGEIESEFGEIGQILQPDGTFFTPPPPPLQPSEVDKLKEEIALLKQRDAQMQDDNNFIMEALIAQNIIT